MLETEADLNVFVRRLLSVAESGRDLQSDATN